MKEFDNLKAIWDQQNQQAIPDVSHIIDKAEKEKNSIRNKIIIQVLALSIAMIVMCVVLCMINFKMAITLIGMAIMLITIFVFSAIRIYQVQQLNKINLTESPKIVLQKLNAYCTFDKKVKIKGMLIYFILLNIGMGFYFVETLNPLSVTLKIIFLIVYIAWMLFAYFVMGKKQLKKDEDKMNFLIKSIENLEHEYEN